MKRTNWKRLQPTSLRQALEWCKEHAREKRNLSIEGIAAKMGLADHWTLYKWINTGRIPAVMIAPYEAVCGIDFVTRWLAANAGKLIVDIPTGKKAKPEDMVNLQELLNSAVGSLLVFYAGKAEATDTLAAIQHGMEAMAWHRTNVQKHAQPELELGGNP